MFNDNNATNNTFSVFDELFTSNMPINQSEYLIVKTGIFKKDTDQTSFIPFSDIKKVKCTESYVLVNNEYLLGKSDPKKCKDLYDKITDAWQTYRNQNTLEDLMSGINALLYSPPNDGGPFYKEAKRNFSAN